MADISAKQVQELRQATSSGMMDAKRALVEADGDFEAAVQVLREKGLAKAATRADRENTEGLVAVATNETAVAMVHLKSETDFAAKSPDFVSLAQELAELVLSDGPGAVASKKAEVEELQLTIKENIEVGTVEKLEAGNGTVTGYCHGGGRIGVLLKATNVDPEVLHEVALHAAFAKPKYLNADEVPADDLEKERQNLIEITKAEGKPEAAIEKIVEGRLNSWLGESVLMNQGLFGEKETVANKIGAGSIEAMVVVAVGV